MKKIYMLLVTLLMTIASLAQSDWYKNENAVYDDPYSFDRNFFMLYKKGLNLDGSPASGKMYAKFKKAEIDKIWANPGHEDLFESLKVTDANKPTFAKHFRDIGSYEVPFLLQLVGEISTFVGYGVKLLDIAHKMDNNRKSTAAELGALIANDGLFERRISFSLKDADKYYVTLLNIYKIKVGAEDRRYVVSRNVFAVKVE